MSNQIKKRDDLAMEVELELMSIALLLSKQEGMDELVQKLKRSIDRVRLLSISEASHDPNS